MIIDAIVSRVRPMFGYHPNPKACSRSLAAFQNSKIPVINPSLTTLQFLVEPGSNRSFVLVEQARRAVRAGAGSLHLDFFDDNYVDTGEKGNNLSILTPNLADYIVKEAGAPLDTHFMVRPSTLGGELAFRNYIGKFIRAGSSFVSVHYSAFEQDGLQDRPLADFLRFVRDRGANAGLAINPDEGPKALLKYQDQIDFALVMSVVPGAGGRGFDQRALSNLAALRDDCFAHLIAVDGAIKPDTIGDVFRLGGNWTVAGSFWFGTPKTNQDLRPQEQMAQAYRALIDAARPAAL